MSYILQIRLGSTTVELTWDAGTLSGDATLIRRLRSEARRFEGVPIGPPTGPFTLRHHLTDPLSTLFLLRTFVEAQDILAATGDVPEAPEVPPNTIA